MVSSSSSSSWFLQSQTIKPPPIPVERPIIFSQKDRKKICRGGLASENFFFPKKEKIPHSLQSPPRTISLFPPITLFVKTMEIAPHVRLYKHALESIFAHLCLADLARVLATCRDWAAAVGGMRPIGARAEVRLHALRNSRLMVRHVAEIRCTRHTQSKTNPFQRIGRLELGAVCDIIRQSKSLTTVNLSGNLIGVEGMRARVRA